MSTQTQPAPVLWHREAAEEIYYDSRCDDLKQQYAAIIAAHDPHQETVRLLERAATIISNPQLHAEIRAHLAKLKEGAK